MATFAHEMLLMGLASVLGVLVSLAYRSTNTEIVHSQAFMQALVLTSCTVSMIMLATNDLASAFVIVGVLGVVSFRTVLRNTREFVFLLLALAAGMSAGAGRWQIGLAGTAVVLVLALALHRVNYGRHAARAFVVKVQGPTEQLHRTDDVLAQACDRVRQLGVAKTSAIQGAFSYEILLRPGVGSHELLNLLLERLPDAEVTVTLGRKSSQERTT